MSDTTKTPTPPAAPYVAAAAALEEYIRVNRKGSSGGSIRCC
jgi:hypothetical protein